MDYLKMIVLLSTLLLPTAGHGSELVQSMDGTGKGLLVSCKGLVQNYIDGNKTGSDIEYGFCAGFIKAMTQLMAVSHGYNTSYCFPKEMTTGQAAHISLNYLKAHPQTQNYPAFYAVMSSMEEAFPCKG